MIAKGAFSLSEAGPPLGELTDDQIGEALAGAYRYLHQRALELEAAEKAAQAEPAETKAAEQ